MSGVLGTNFAPGRTMPEHLESVLKSLTRIKEECRLFKNSLIQDVSMNLRTEYLTLSNKNETYPTSHEATKASEKNISENCPGCPLEKCCFPAPTSISAGRGQSFAAIEMTTDFIK